MKMPSRLYPPHYLLLSILSIVGIDSLLQVPFVSSTIALVGGLLFLLSGIVLAASAARLFSKAILQSSQVTKNVPIIVEKIKNTQHFCCLFILSYIQPR